MEKLQIPTAIQGLLDSINSTKLNLGETKIDKHPLVAQDLDRYIQIPMTIMYEVRQKISNHPVLEDIGRTVNVM